MSLIISLVLLAILTFIVFLGSLIFVDYDKYLQNNNYRDKVQKNINLIMWGVGGICLTVMFCYELKHGL